ncbi:MAG: 50S ribosomal protein L37ae [archaeon]
MATKKVGSAGRFGARYGKRLRQKIVTVEKIQRKQQQCPYCNRRTVKRLSAGIWHCGKCESKFTSKAYKVE